MREKKINIPNDMLKAGVGVFEDWRKAWLASPSSCGKTLKETSSEIVVNSILKAAIREMLVKDIGPTDREQELAIKYVDKTCGGYKVHREIFMEIQKRIFSREVTK